MIVTVHTPELYWIEATAKAEIATGSVDNTSQTKLVVNGYVACCWNMNLSISHYKMYCFMHEKSLNHRLNCSYLFLHGACRYHATFICVHTACMNSWTLPFHSDPNYKKLWWPAHYGHANSEPLRDTYMQHSDNYCANVPSVRSVSNHNIIIATFWGYPLRVKV